MHPCSTFSQLALQVAQDRLDDRANEVNWIVGDVTQASLPSQHYAVWHDRAVFHFLIDPELRAAYVRQALDSPRLGGSFIIATFGPEGPTQCSELDVTRYDIALLHEQFGPRFELVTSSTEDHVTPAGNKQQFVCGHFRLKSQV